MAVRRRTDPAAGRAAVAAWLAGEADAAQVRTAVRFTLEELAAAAPGRAVEVRGPPAGAVQCVPGPRHTRGPPPAVMEMTPDVWLGLATGRLDWAAAVAAGQVRASGERADLAGLLPL